MKGFRFTIGPEIVKVPYLPYSTFRERLGEVALEFGRMQGTMPNVAYVSNVHFKDGPLLRDKKKPGLKTQTLLDEDTVLIGYEVPVELGGEHGREQVLDTRAV